MFFLRLVKAFQSKRIPFAVTGGYAVALHGIVRATMDIDLVLNLKKSDFEKAEELLSELGLNSRIPLKASELIEFRKEYIERKNLIAWSFVNPKKPTEVVDIIITQDLKTLKIKKIKVGTDSVPVVSIGDLIKMKRASGRPQDLVDIENLEKIKNAKKA